MSVNDFGGPPANRSYWLGEPLMDYKEWEKKYHSPAMQDGEMPTAEDFEITRSSETPEYWVVKSKDGWYAMAALRSQEHAEEWLAVYIAKVWGFKEW